MHNEAFKTIGIIGAMDVEIEFLRSKISESIVNKFGLLEFYVGKLFDLNVVIVKSGIGKVNATICAQQLIDRFNCDCILNVGIAGAISEDVSVGEIVIANSAIYHDFDATAAGYDLGKIPDMPKSEFVSNKQLIQVFEHACQDCNVAFHTGVIASGDVFVANDFLKKKIWNSTHALCVEMEGAAIAHTCFVNNIPFATIRSISDGANDDASETYSQNEQNSSGIASEVVYVGLKLISEF